MPTAARCWPLLPHNRGDARQSGLCRRTGVVADSGEHYRLSAVENPLEARAEELLAADPRNPRILMERGTLRLYQGEAPGGVGRPAHRPRCQSGGEDAGGGAGSATRGPQAGGAAQFRGRTEAPGRIQGVLPRADSRRRDARPARTAEPGAEAAQGQLSVDPRATAGKARARRPRRWRPTRGYSLAPMRSSPSGRDRRSAGCRWSSPALFRSFARLVMQQFLYGSHALALEQCQRLLLYPALVSVELATTLDLRTAKDCRDI